MKHVLAILLAGGAGERLHPLTRNRAKPAVPFGGLYRIIDFSLSNCINSNCRRIQVLVQYKSLSLSRHIRYGWDIMHSELGEFIEVVPPQQRVNNSWYLGTADAIYQNLYSIERERPREVLILSGDHIYKMNYERMVGFHREAGADLTIAAIETRTDEASRFGVLEVDATGRVVAFQEKPAKPKTIPGRPNVALVSMGVYVFNTDLLTRACTEDAERTQTTHDFGRDIVPRLVESNKVYAYTFQDENRKSPKYWRDVGTIDAYWEAHMDLVSVEPEFNLYDRDWPLRTAYRVAPPAKFVFGEQEGRFGVAVDSVVSPGCIVSGGMVRRSVLSPDVRINSYSYVEESILMEAASIGRHARVRRAIVEKFVNIPEGAVIGYDLQEDAKRFRVTSNGIVVVERRDGQA